MRFFVFTLSVIFLLSGCQSFWQQKKPMHPFIVQAKGVLVMNSSALFSQEYFLQIENDKTIPLSSSALDLAAEVGNTVLLSGLWTPLSKTSKASLQVLEMKPVSYAWKSSFFPSLQGSFSIPSYITTEEKEGVVTFFIEGDAVFAFQKKEKMPEQIQKTSIVIGKDLEAFRSLEQDTLKLFIPQFSLEATAFDKSGDSSLLYSLIETYVSEKEKKEKRVHSSKYTPNDWFLLSMNAFLEEGSRSFSPHIKEIKKMIFSGSFMEVEYKDLSGNFRRSFFQTSPFSHLATYQFDESQNPIWGLQFGSLPENFDLFSADSLSTHKTDPLPENFVWLYSDDFGLQMAYPKDMYFFRKENTISFVWQMGPTLLESSKNTSSCVLEKERTSFSFSCSDDFPKDLQESMKESVRIIY